MQKGNVSRTFKPITYRENMTKINDDKKFFRKIYLILGCTLAFLVWVLFFKMISPGYVGVVVNLFGDKKGAQPKELSVGMHWVAPWTRVYTFPVFAQNHVWDGDRSFTFQTGEGLNVNADMGISYHLDPDCIHTLFCKYRRGIAEITDVFIRNYTRDAINKIASKMSVEELYGTEKEGFVDAVQGLLRRDLGGLGIVVDRLYLIGTLHFPAQVVNALNSKIEATQRAQQRENELREAKAQAEKEIAKAQGLAQSALIKARAEAEANMMLTNSISPHLVAWQAVQNWDGKLPVVMGADTIIPMDLFAPEKKK
jgi:regulator of protease activity HflC (stomatin/prohibitin superfamily)